MITNIWFVGSAVTLSCHHINDMLDCTGRARFYNQKRSYANSHQVAGKSLESFFGLHKEWNFLGQKFLTIAVSLKDIEQGL